MNGIFLVALGAVWKDVRLSPRLERGTFWAALYGSYANWVTTVLAAALGTAALTPLTSVGHRGNALQEALVTFGFGSVGLATIVTSLLLLWGLRQEARRLERAPDPAPGTFPSKS